MFKPAEHIETLNDSTGNPYIMVERKSYDVTLGQDVNISIEAQGSPVPRPDQIKWSRFNSTLLRDGNHYDLDDRNSTLFIYNITRRQLGLYQVHVTTVKGTTSVVLAVQEFIKDSEGGCKHF